MIPGPTGIPFIPTGNPTTNYWSGLANFRDASDYILFKKRNGLLQISSQPTRPQISQSLQNRNSLQFAILDCLDCPGGFPTNVKLPYIP